MRRVITKAILALAVAALVGGAVVEAGGDEDRYRARLTVPRGSGDVSGQADFRERGSRRKFSVEVEGFRPGQLFDVMVAGEVVGTVLINNFGVGELDFDDRADPDDEDEPFPPKFPAINGGELVQVGTVSGTLQPK